MLTSRSEQSTPAELSMKSVLMRPPRSAYSMRPRCVKPRLPPSATTRQRSSAPFTRTASLAGSPASALRLVARLHVGADAAVPEQIDRAAGWRGSARAARACRARCRARPAPSGAARSTWSGASRCRRPRTCSVAVVVVPARARQLEQPLALREASRGVRIGIDEDVAVIERGDELHVRRQQQAVAEHVAAHVADADTVKSCLAGRRRSSRKWRFTASHAPRAVIPSSCGRSPPSRPRRKRRRARSRTRPRARWRCRRTSPCPCRPRRRGTDRRRRCAARARGGTTLPSTSCR